MNRRGALLLMAAGAGTLWSGGARALPDSLRLPSELANQVSALPGLVSVGARQPTVTLYEFFDYNCPFCKQSGRDVRGLITSDRRLAYGLVNYAVLGIPSIGATRVALAYAKSHEPATYLVFHEKMLGLRGTVDGTRALELAVTLGANRAALLEEANSDATTKAMTEHVRLGDSLGLRATPSYVALTEAFEGFLAVPEKKKIIANVRACEKAVC
jgi:protein-disulfide isomerase